MFSLYGRKVRSQAPCSFPVSGSRNKATASTRRRKLFTQDSFGFSGSQSIDYKWPKISAKKNNMDVFYSLKKQSCFHNSSKLLLYVSERTNIRKCWPADYTTAIKSAEQKPNVHHVLTFGMIPGLQATLCFQIDIYNLWVPPICTRDTWNIPTKEQPCDKLAQQHIISSWELANKALLSDTTVKSF